MSGRYIVGCNYFSLPEFPKCCKLIHKKDLILRDILLCNKNNKIHFDSGGQYDPHLESSPPEYRYCHDNARRRIYNNRKEYTDIYILFWTNYLYLDGSNRQRLVGYYKIKQDVSNGENTPTLHSEDNKFVGLDGTIDISKFLNQYNLYRVSPSNENPKYKNKLEDLLDAFVKEDKENRFDYYVKETIRLKNIFYKNEKKQNYLECEGCKYWKEKNNDCPLVWRIFSSNWSESGYCNIDIDDKYKCGCSLEEEKG